MFIATVAMNIAGQVNLLILGMSHSISDVGIYTTATLLSSILLFFIEAVSFLYIPVYTSLFAANKKQEMKKIFQIMTKWMVFISLPIVSLLILYPSKTISLIFGDEYSAGSVVLILTSVASFFLLFSSLGWGSLIAIGKTKLCMIFSIVIGITGVLVGIFLIPLLGIVGAAIAVLSQYSIAIIVTFGALYKYNKTHPFTSALIKPLCLYLLFAIGLYFVITFLDVTMGYFTIFIILLIFYILIVLSVIFGGGLEKYDIEILVRLERKSGLNLHYLRKIFKRIIR